MKNNAKNNFPQPSVRRLPAYLRMLRKLKGDGQFQISCTRIAKELNLDSTQVRKDLAITGIAGKPRVGYEINPLIASIEVFLGWNHSMGAFLVGAGNLGKALIGYENFTNYGLQIKAAFDVDPDKVGETIFGREVYPLSRMGELARQGGVMLGILTVPAQAAQAASEIMVAAGLRGIWNFSPVKLDLPDSVVVENVELVSSLAVLSLRLLR
ncbi:MAG: redox-sensing transcriptional repressor Rex [Planctomycetota bacterium]|jgi:redox-sensing transcriptional repressor|nr:redox-sensing transcriptional repressor Rex [Planctomycetota bacterium]